MQLSDRMHGAISYLLVAYGVFAFGVFAALLLGGGGHGSYGWIGFLVLAAYAMITVPTSLFSLVPMLVFPEPFGGYMCGFIFLFAPFINVGIWLLWKRLWGD